MLNIFLKVHNNIEEEKMHELNVLVDKSKDTENVADDTGHNSDECEDTRDEVTADGQDVRLFFWLSTLEDDGGCKRRLN